MKRSLIAAACLAVMLGGCVRKNMDHSDVPTIERSDIQAAGLEQPWTLKPANIDVIAVKGVIAARDDYYSVSGQLLEFDRATQGTDGSVLYLFFRVPNAKDRNVVYVFNRRENRNVRRFFWSE